MKAFVSKTISLRGRRISYRIVQPKRANKLKVRIGPQGMEVVHPTNRSQEDIQVFLRTNENWIFSQLDRIKRLRSLRKLVYLSSPKKLLFHGEPVQIRMNRASHSSRNKVDIRNGHLIIECSTNSRTSPSRSLENWLRKQTRDEIISQLEPLTRRINRFPRSVYIMGQRTKWGNCSTGGVLSFNWRLICAPPMVLRYIVTHEALHLQIPDHSAKFWLTLRSICPDAQQAKQWLSVHGERLLSQSDDVLASLSKHNYFRKKI